MLSIMLAASLGGQPACQAATGYGYAAQSYLATPYLSQGYGTANYGYAAPTYATKVVTAYVPVNQYEARTEIVGDQARAQQFAQQRLQVDTSLINAITGMATELKSFKEQVARATQAQDRAIPQQAPPPPPPQYPVQASPQSPPPPSKSPPDVGRVPPPPRASPQVPQEGWPGPSPSDGPPPPSDASQDQQGTFPTQGPSQGLQAPPPPPPPQPQPQASNGPPSPAMQAATAILYKRCGQCHLGPNGSGGFAILESKDRLASYSPDFLKMLDQVAYRGYVLKPDGTKLKMPPNGRGPTSEEWSQIHAAADIADQEATLASNTRGGR
jgi:hypothetical protein